MIFTDLFESPEPCPECGGVSFSDLVLAEKHDACYNKVRSRYKVWPSAYASGALVQCRKKGAANWGNKSKNESMAEGRDMCHVCGQTPCNCTHLNEAVAAPGRRLIKLFNLIYSNGGDDSVDYLMTNAPIFADYYDQYEGDLESIAAEVDAKELAFMVSELEEVAENEGLAEGLGQNLSVQQLATISDEALDKAYGYGRSTPGNTFGWQANLMSAAYAKKMIDAGVTDIEAISDAIHKGWNITAQKFVQNPDQFDDTEKLRQAGKLDAKLQQRAKLMKINYAQLDNEEQEKDRVVARALLQAIKGQQSVAEGADDNILDEAAPWVDKLGLGNFFRKIKNVDADNQKEIRILSGVNHSMQLYFKTILALNAQAGPAASLFWPLLGKQALLFAGGAAAYTIGKILATKLGRALFGSTEEALAWAQAHLAAGKNKESKFEFDGKQYPVTVVDPASIANLEQQIAQLEGIVTNKQSRAAKAEYQKSLRQSKKVYQGVAEGRYPTDDWELISDIESTTGKFLGSVLQHLNGTYGFYDVRKSNIESGFSSPEEARQAFVELHNARRRGVAEGSLNEFALGDSGDDRTYEYEVYQCNPDDVFDWIGGPLYKTDRMDKAHSIAYELWKKHPDKAFMIWQERSQGSRGGYGIKDDEQGVAEMDKSQPSHGRDGRISHSTYGSRDKQSTVGGKEHTAHATTADKMMKDAYKEMMKSMNNAEKADKGWRNPNMDEGSGLSDRTLIGYLTKVAADAQKHPADPTKRSPEKASRSVGGFAQAFNKLDARKEPVNEISPEGPDSDEDYREWERLKDVHKQPYSPDWDDDDDKFMQKWYQERGLEETSDQEADYGKSYQDMVKRMGAKAREQEQTRPVDISDLARRLRDIEKKSGN